MTSYNSDVMAQIISRFDFNLINGRNPADFRDFCVMDSKKYATKLYRIVVAQNLTPEEFTTVVVFATAVKNKKRIMNSMKPFRGKPWFKNVESFFRNNVIQYTGEEEEDTFPVVHIPSCLPFLASRIWLQITTEPTVEKFLQNLWAAQINLDAALMARQKAFETNFWTEVVKKGGSNYEEYWDTKASDKYPLLKKDGTAFGNANVIAGTQAYSEAAIQKWINTKVAYVA